MKALDPYYCPGSKGGNRKSIFKDYELPLLKTVLLAYLEENPTANKESIRQHLILVFSRYFNIISIYIVLSKLFHQQL
jgi:hypothetical protein